MLKMCILERPPYQFLSETTIFTSLVIRVSYQYTPSSSHDPVHDFSPLVRGFTWNDMTHSIISLLELIIHVLRARTKCTTRYFCGNAYWRKPYSRGFDSLSNEYSFREDKSKLKNRSMPVCISLDLSSYEKGRDTKEAKRSIKVTR